MQIGVLGINHKSATLELREKLADACDTLFGKKHILHPSFSFVLLSTCNRLELYFSSLDLSATHSFLLQLLRALVDENFEHALYTYFHQDCFLHLARVTAGVDSAILGESEIQGQVKSAYHAALKRTLTPELHFLFQKCLKVGKKVRTHFSIKGAFHTLEEAVYQKGSMHFEALEEKRILFVGVSEINHKIFRYLQKKGCEQLFICNRTLSKAESLGVSVLPWEKRALWSTFDCAIFGTKARDFLAKKEDLPKEGSRQLVIDLSVPRNVDPAVKQRGVSLMNIDEINAFLNQKKQTAEKLVAKIEEDVLVKEAASQTALFKRRALKKSARLFA